MKRRQKYIFTIILIIFSYRFTCNSSDSAKTPITLNIVNNFNVPVLVEIWSGIDLLYDTGRIKGSNAKKEQSLATISNISPNNTLNVTPSDKNISLLVIFGTDQGTSGIIYLTELKISNYNGTGTVTIIANGDTTYK